MKPNGHAIAPTHSSKPFSIHSGDVFGTIVDPGTVPWWMAEIVYNIHVKIVRGRVPTLHEIEAQGGYEPISFLDFLAGGLGDGTAASAVLERSTTSLVTELGAVGIAGGSVKTPMVVVKSALPFPLTGARVDDGTALGASTVPEWMARIAYEQFLKARRTQGAVGLPPYFEAVRLAGGFKPEAFLDLLAGGSGSGHAYLSVVRRRAPGPETFLSEIITATKKIN